ncbi:winged helix-turn-helix domain-containing protein [Nonomuraea sp. NEAU-A123]|uniref:helix-turn-helix domain-containing protein n=1 Tax=Nonomuraea sp. NEAU-A123 TaxID=2839649 RepID=UPI001BE421C6|nr:winged helix-turn-helix domain-containing protein [Nonomuraea sp. NEAU-A123]
MLGGVSYLLHRMGWSWQAPAQRAAERDEQAGSVGGQRSGRPPDGTLAALHQKSSCITLLLWLTPIATPISRHTASSGVRPSA